MKRSSHAGRQLKWALTLTGTAAIGLLLSSARSAWAADSDDVTDLKRSPNDDSDTHRFDIRGMDRRELTRAFAGQLTIAPQPAAPPKSDKEIVFIDPGVPEREKLIRSIGKKARVIELTSNADGLSQIAAALAGERNIGAVHIISHGGEARIKLAGAADVSLETLPEHAGQLGAIHNAMVPGGDVLLYGCDIAKGDDGKLFVNLLAKLTGENVAASENLTGASARGGDWKLEYSAGRSRRKCSRPTPKNGLMKCLRRSPRIPTAEPVPCARRSRAQRVATRLTLRQGSQDRRSL